MPEIHSKEREMSRAECVRVEMASAVRLLGGDALSVKEAANIAARKTGLSARLIERLRYRKITRIAADVADIIREALAAQQAKQDALARHEITILATRLQALEQRLDVTDAEFFGADAIPALQSLRGNGVPAGPGPSSTTEGDER